MPCKTSPPVSTRTSSLFHSAERLSGLHRLHAAGLVARFEHNDTRRPELGAEPQLPAPSAIVAAPQPAKLGRYLHVHFEGNYVHRDRVHEGSKRMGQIHRGVQENHAQQQQDGPKRKVHKPAQSACAERKGEARQQSSKRHILRLLSRARLHSVSRNT